MKLLHNGAMCASVDAAEAYLRRSGAAALRADLSAFMHVNFEGLIDPDTDVLAFQPPIIPPIVPAGTHDELVEISKRAMSLICRTLSKRFAENWRYFAQSLGWTDRMMRTLDADTFSNRLALEVARPDILMHRGRPYVLELNVDCAVGGKMAGSRGLESALMLPYVSDVAKSLDLEIRSPIRALKRLIASAARERGHAAKVRVAILDYRSEFYLREFEARLLSDDIITAHFVAIDEIDLKRGDPFHHNDFILKCCEISDELDLLPAEVADRFIDLFSDPSKTVLSNGYSTLLSNKLAFGIVHEEQEDGEARCFFERYLPWSRLIRPGLVRFHSEEADMVVLLQACRRDQFVLKKGFGWGGNDVLWGKQCTETVWNEAVRTALESNQWLIQEYLKPDTIEMPFLGDDNRICWRKNNVLLGPYILGAQPGGCQYILTHDIGCGMSGPLYQSSGFGSFTVQ